MALDLNTQIPTNSASTGETSYWRTGADEIGSFEDGRAAEPGFSFGDFIDLINPLQHIPIVSDIYREITGDSIRPDVKATGSAFYGGPIGLVSGLARAIVTAEMDAGQAPGANAIAARPENDEIPATNPESTPNPARPEPAQGQAQETHLAAASAPNGAQMEPTVETSASDALLNDTPVSPIEDLILRGLIKYDAMRG